MFKKLIAIFIALVVVVAVVLGVGAALAQEEEDAAGYGPGHMWGWQQDGEEPAMPYGPGHMGQWRQDGDEGTVPYGPGMMGGWMMGEWMMDGNTLLDIVAQALDMTVPEVEAELSEGISIAELAENHGVDVEVIISAFSEAHAAALQEAVEAGELTQEQADWMQENMAAMIAAHVNQPWNEDFGPGAGPGGCHGYDSDDMPGAGAGFGPRGHGGMHGGWGGGWQQAPAAAQGPGA